MKETRMSGDGSSEMPLEDSKSVSQAPKTPLKKSRESLWGVMVLACMILFVAASVAGIGWVVYGQWKNERSVQDQPSIQSLSEQSVEETTTPSTESSQPTDTAKTPDVKQVSDSMEAAKKLGISVLNGGGTKGSAGVLADFLKSEGYLKASAGNTLKDYAGVTIYHAATLEKEAEAIKESVVKKYPQAKVLPADTNNKETSASQVTIILGK